MRKQVAFIAAFIMLLSSVVVLGNFTARVKADETTTAYCLELQDLKALAKDGEGNDTGIYWNVSFSYNSTGYFSNDIPAEGNISMEYDSIQESRIDVPGEVFGIGRGMQKNKFIMSEPNGAFGFHYNGWCTSFSPVGFNKIVYDASTHGATHNGSVINKHNIGYGNDFAGVDASARYFAIQWLGGTYSATLENMKIYDESGWDLGVYLDNGNINSGSAQRFVEENKTVVIRPSDETRDIIKIKFQNSEGQQIIGEAYDNLNVVNNQDGTYSFEMPSYALNVAADTKPKTASLLNLTNAVAKAQHVFHDVEFAYNESGYISNNAPAVGNITMQYSATATDRVSVPGEVMGIARGAEKISSSTLTDPRGAFGFHFNGGDSTFTPVGNSNIVYDTATHSAMHNGNVLNKHGYIYANDFAGIETSARYFGIQWLGGTYSAKLENMKIYDESGWDLGVYLSTGNQLSGQVRKLATIAETIVIKPELPAGHIFSDWIIKDSSGNPYDLEITEITEGELKGYYSFIMPAEEISLLAQFVLSQTSFENIGLSALVQEENGQKNLSLTVNNGFTGFKYQYWIKTKVITDKYLSNLGKERYIWQMFEPYSNNPSSNTDVDENYLVNGSYEVIVRVKYENENVVKDIHGSYLPEDIGQVKINTVSVDGRSGESLYVADKGDGIVNINIVGNGTSYSLQKGGVELLRNGTGVFVLDVSGYSEGLYKLKAIAENGTFDEQEINIYVYGQYKADQIAVINSLSGTSTEQGLTTFIMELEYANGNDITVNQADAFDITLYSEGTKLQSPQLRINGAGKLEAVFTRNYSGYGIYRLYGKVNRKAITGEDDNIIVYYNGYARTTTLTHTGSQYTVTLPNPDPVEENRVYETITITAELGSIEAKRITDLDYDDSKVDSANLRYAFYREDASGWVLIKDYGDTSNDNTLYWTPKKAGIYNIQIRIKDINAGSYEKAVNNVYTVISGGLNGNLAVNAFDYNTGDKAINYYAGKPYLITADYKGTENVLYMFTVYNTNTGLMYLNYYTTSNSIMFVANKNDTYVITARVINVNSFGFKDKSSDIIIQAIY